MEVSNVLKLGRKLISVYLLLLLVAGNTLPERVWIDLHLDFSVDELENDDLVGAVEVVEELPEFARQHIVVRLVRQTQVLVVLGVVILALRLLDFVLKQVVGYHAWWLVPGFADEVTPGFHPLEADYVVPKCIWKLEGGVVMLELVEMLTVVFSEGL